MGNSLSLSSLSIEDYRLMNLRPDLPQSQKIFAKMMKVTKKLYPYLESKLTEAMCVADNTKPDCPLVYINDAFESMTLYPKEDVIGRNCRFLGGKYTSKKAIKKISMAIQEGKECEVELLNYRKDGMPFLNHFLMLPLWAKGKRKGRPTHFLGLQLDVTLLKMNNTAPSHWTVPEVAHFLEGLDLGDNALAFVDAGVSGRRLLKMTERDLLKLGLTIEGDRKSLLAEIEGLKKKEQDERDQATPFLFDYGSLSMGGGSNSIHNGGNNYGQFRPVAGDADDSLGANASESVYVPPPSKAEMKRRAVQPEDLVADMTLEQENEMLYEALMEDNGIVETLIGEGRVEKPSYQAIAEATRKAHQADRMRFGGGAPSDDEEDEDDVDDDVDDPLPPASARSAAAKVQRGVTEAALPRAASVWSANRKKDSVIAVKLLFADSTVVVRVRRTISVGKLESKARRVLHLKGASLQFEGRTLDEELWRRIIDTLDGSTIKLTVRPHGPVAGMHYDTTEMSATEEEKGPFAAAGRYSLDDVPCPLLLADDSGDLTDANGLAVQLLGIKLSGPGSGGLKLRDLLPQFDFSNRRSRVTLTDVTDFKENELVPAMVSVQFVQQRTTVAIMPISPKHIQMIKSR